MFKLDDGEVITELQQAVAVVEGTAKVTYGESSKVTSFRLPLTIMAEVQGLAVKCGKTKNATISMLLAVALEEVRKGLSPDTMQQVNELTSEAYAELIPEDLKC